MYPLKNPKYVTQSFRVAVFAVSLPTNSAALAKPSDWLFAQKINFYMLRKKKMRKAQLKEWLSWCCLFQKHF